MSLVHKLKNTGVFRRFCRMCLLLAVTASLTVSAHAASAADFTDLRQSAWYYDAVSFVTDKGLFNGTTATTFSPSGSMTRGMFVTVLGRYAGVDPAAWCAGTVTGSGVNVRSGPGTNYAVVTTLSKNASVTLTGESGSWYKIKSGASTGYISKDYITPKYHRFADVDYSAYYAGYVIWGYEKGIVSGMTDTQFSPNSNVTREQICKLLAGYASSAGIKLRDSGEAVAFTDAASISSWAQSGIDAMQRAGVIQGEEDGAGYRFRPKSSASRAEAAIIFQRFASAGTGTATATDAEPTEASDTPSTPTASTDRAITPATLVDGSVSVKSDVVRVGILANTKNYSRAVSSVTLECVNGGNFQYGSFSGDRRFRYAGDLSAGTLTITSDGSTFTVKDGGGNVLLTTSDPIAIHPAASDAVTRVNGEYRYRGDFELRQAYNASGKITVVNYVGIEDYVKGVIPYEFGNTWPAETLKAAAVCARTYVMASDWSVYAGYGFDVMGSTDAQLYRGRAITYSESYFRTTDAAADATAGQYLTYNGSLCETYFFACDGGATEDYAHVWGGSGHDYLVGKVDPYEAAVSGLASNYTYSITQSRTGSAMQMLLAKFGLDDTHLAKNGIRVRTYDDTGNVESVTLETENGWVVTIDQWTDFDRWDFLSAFGFTAYSYRYSVTYDAASDSFTCTRLGWGHNIGLSQWGAYAMASSYGKNYQDILGFYYDGTHLQYGAY